jgi:phosphate transport system permease protein
MRRALIVDRVATAALWAVAVLVVSLLVAIIAHFVIASLPTFSLSFLFSAPLEEGIGGIGPLLFNSLYMLVLTMLMTVPIGVLGGIYMAEYASENRFTNAIRFSQEVISSIPSIVVGLFGMTLFVIGLGWGFTALGGALTLLVFNLPLLLRLCEQAIRAVPDDERAASLALGASKWQTIRHAVLPVAIPGIVTGIVLTAGRVFGEAAALLFTAGVATPAKYDYTNVSLLDPRSPWSPFHQATTLSVYIWNINSESMNSAAAQISAMSSMVLLLMVLLFNLSSRWLGRALQRRVSGL